MGVCLTWFAVRGKTPDKVLADLGLQKTGQSVPSSGLRRYPRILAAELPTGYYLVQRGRYECRDKTVFARLSSGCEVISLFVEEHVMVSHICGWKNGNQLWSLIYDSEKGDQHLETTEGIFHSRICGHPR